MIRVGVVNNPYMTDSRRREKSRSPPKNRQCSGYDVGRAGRRPSNVTIRDPLRNNKTFRKTTIGR